MLKKFLVLLIVPTSLLIVGCQTPDEALTAAENLRSDVLTKVTQVQGGITDVVTDAKAAYEKLLDKKKQLEELVVQVNSTVAALDKLLGKTETTNEATRLKLENEKAELQKTIDELQNELGQTRTSIEDAEFNQVVQSLG